MKAAFAAKCSEDNTFPLDFYHGLEAYMTTNISARKFSRIALLMIDDQEETPVTMAPMERMRMNGRLSRRTRTAFRKPFWNCFIKKHKLDIQDPN
ncbi:hypothetical protein [Muricoprocola aceti]|uniref:Uncharacterized protein n=1 Tax=Muricoprocola aceti TaxID=2981772 RepID=A0ABT2SHM2_9FIRM|nr:hypothetical protein [Muricoprocola aceti]MCU6723861.1 hypothetical protein [Muricoprocola aceti]